MNPATEAATIHARRITGGAIVTVTRPDGRVRRHHVGLRRFNRLADTLVAHRAVAGGEFTRNGFDLALHNVEGLQEARAWAALANRRQKHWRHH